jgi:putative ABC transport system permease protein
VHPLALALRNLVRHKFRTGLTLVAIVVGVAGIVLAGGFVHDMFIQLGEALIHSQSGHLQVARAGYFEKGSGQPENYPIAEPAAMRRELAQWPLVEDVTTRLNLQGLLSNLRTDRPVLVQGVEPGREARLSTYMRITEGRALRDSDTMGIMLGQGIARALDLMPGASATLLVNTAEGGLNTLEFEVVGIFQTFSLEFDARAVQIPLAAAQELIGSPTATTLVVTLKRTEDTEAAAAAFRSRLAPTGLEVITWTRLNDFYGKTVTLYEQQFGVLQVIILVMVMLGVANSVNIGVFERMGEFGTMMAMGNRTRDVFALIVLENAILGLAGAALGVAAGIGTAVLVSSVGIPMPPPPNANLGYLAYIRVVPAVVALAFGVGAAATLLASLIPAARVARTPVAMALRANL